MKKIICLLVSLLALISGTVSHADQGAEAKIRAALGNKFPQSQVKRVELSPLPGLYEVEMPPHIFYMSADGRYIINGDLIDLPGDRNITQDKKAGMRVGTIEGLGEENMIIFAPKQVKHTITVFTDIDCGYCRKLHKEIEEYNKLGIKVRYLAYPRSGPGSKSFKKAESVWCADDRKQAMTDAKQGKAVPDKSCDNPVKQHFITGAQLGVTGTPAIFLQNGQLLPGYYPAANLIKVLESNKG